MSALTDILSTEVSLSRLWAQAPAAWRAFASCWRSELFSLLPESLVAWVGGTAGPVIRLGLETNGVRVEGVSTTGRVSQNGTIAWSDYSVAELDRSLLRIGLKRSDAIVGIVLPEIMFFRRSFGIPVRAYERVHAIAKQELEHRTPFQAESVYLGMVIEPRQKDSQTVTIRQTIVRRELVEEAVRRLDLSLAEISFVAPMGDKDSPASSISLHPEADRQVPFTRRVLWILIVTALITAGLDATLFWRRQEHTITAIEAEIDLVRERALAVRGIEQEITRIRSALVTLENQRASLSSVDVWQETSRVLPDHSWVTDWRFRDGLISMAGFSAAATELVGLFEKSSLFTQANLDAPITFDAVNERERFSLVVRTRADAPSGQP